MEWKIMQAAGLHRDRIIHSVRFAAAPSGEQKRLTPTIVDELTNLQDGRLDCWEHATAFERTVGIEIFSESERRKIQELVDLLALGDPESREEAIAILDELRPRAYETLSLLGWHGGISEDLFPRKVLGTDDDMS